MSEQFDSAADRNDAGSDGSFSARLKNAWIVEFSNFRWRLLVCSLLMRLLPEGKALALRTLLVRAIGLRVGSGTYFSGSPKIQSNVPGPLQPRLQIGANCRVGVQVILEFGEVLTIGNGVSIGDRAVIITTTHQLGPKEHRAGPLVRHPVTIADNVEIGEGAIILPGATLGEGARVMPFAVVNANVAAGVTVSGIPARPVRAT